MAGEKLLAALVEELAPKLETKLATRAAARAVPLAVTGATRAASKAAAAAVDPTGIGLGLDPDLLAAVAKKTRPMGRAPTSMDVVPPAAPLAVGAPAIVGKANPADTVIAARQAELGVPKGARRQPLGVNPMFETTPEAYARTTDIVPQSSREDAIARIPFLPEGDMNYPKKGRVLPILERQHEIGAELARMTSDLVGSNVSNFYHTGPVHEGLDRIGVDPSWIRDSFAPTYAGTSPRTETTQNLRNASMIDYLRGQGIPINEDTYASRGNISGYPMLGSHYALSDRLLRGAHDPMINPKPSEFMPGVSGDLTGVTGDTHHIRGVLKAFNNIYPGDLPVDWLVPGARAKYLDTGTFNPASDVDDSLATAARGGRKAQVEYGPMSMPTFHAADINKVPGGAQQAMQWFGFGDETGLASEPKTMTQLLNDRLDVTGQVLGISPEEVMRLYAKKGTTLMAEGGSVGRYACGGPVRPTLAVMQ